MSDVKPELETIITTNKKALPVTYVLFLNEQVDSGEITANVLSDDLRLNLVDPAINVVTALLVQHVTVWVKQLLTLVSDRVVELLPDKQSNR